MTTFFLRALSGFYMGLGLAYVDIYFYDWEFWAFIVPMSIFIGIGASTYNK